MNTSAIDTRMMLTYKAFQGGLALGDDGLGSRGDFTQGLFLAIPLILTWLLFFFISFLLFLIYIRKHDVVSNNNGDNGQ